MAEPDPTALRQCLERAAAGSREGWDQIVAQHHDRLRRMVALRLDPRLRNRLDPSDVLQEAYLDAATRLPDYVQAPEVPFYLWLRGLAVTRLAKLHRAHLATQKRDAGRDVSLDAVGAPAVSSAVLADCLLGAEEAPSAAVVRAERSRQLQAALDQLAPLDREVVALRHFEQMTTQEIAATLGISEAAASKRHLRAVERLREVLAGLPGGLSGLRS